MRRILGVLRDGRAPRRRRRGQARPGTPWLARSRAAGFGRIVDNPRADEGQLSSLIAGLDAIDQPDVEAALVTLVDVPRISTAVVSALLARMQTSRRRRSFAPFTTALHGHPVIFRRVLFDRLRHADPAVGAKAVLRAVPVDDVEVA